MDKKVLIGIGVAVVLVIGGIFFLVQPKTPGAPIGQAGGGTSASQMNNVIVPGTTSTNVPAGVALPQSVLPVAAGANSQLRVFNIAIDHGSFSPTTLNVRQGDSLQVRFAAEDRDYDVYQPQYGFSLKILKGTTKLLGFDAVQAGQFQYYCRSCGGPSAGPVGYINVVPTK